MEKKNSCARPWLICWASITNPPNIYIYIYFLFNASVSSSIYCGVNFISISTAILFALKVKVLRTCSMYAYSKSTKGLKKLLVCRLSTLKMIVCFWVYFLLIFSISYVFYLISFWLLDFCLFWVHFLQYLRNVLLSFLPHQDQITAYVEYFGQFTSEQFPEDIAEVCSFRFYFWTNFSHPESWNETYSTNSIYY